VLSARLAVRNLREYHPPLGNREGLRLDFNENTEGCSAKVLQVLKQLTAEDLARYPEREPVEKIVAQHLGLAWEQVLLTNGVDEAIHLLCETYLEPQHEALVVTPTFRMYEIYAGATGAKVQCIPCERDFAFPMVAITRAITPATRMIAIASPNNPTGTAPARGQLLEIATVAPDAALLVDEAYFEFYGKTVIGDIMHAPNLFVARTFSKAYGLAGLRVGILAGPAEQMRLIRRNSSPYSVNAVALAALPIALADLQHVDRYVSQVKHGRGRLATELQSLGIHSWPSQANFLLVRIGESHRAFVAAMRQPGVLVRDRSDDPGCEGCVRITIGTEEQTEQLIRALREVVAELNLRQAATV